MPSGPLSSVLRWGVLLCEPFRWESQSTALRRAARPPEAAGSRRERGGARASLAPPTRPQWRPEGRRAAPAAASGRSFGLREAPSSAEPHGSGRGDAASALRVVDEPRAPHHGRARPGAGVHDPRPAGAGQVSAPGPPLPCRVPVLRRGAAPPSDSGGERSRRGKQPGLRPGPRRARRRSLPRWLRSPASCLT